MFTRGNYWTFGQIFLKKYQTIFELNVEIIVKEKYEKIKEKTEKTIRQLLNLNIYNNKEFEEILKNIKENYKIGNIRKNNIY